MSLNFASEVILLYMDACHISQTSYGYVMVKSSLLFFHSDLFLHRFLRELDLQENEIEDHRGHWLNCFPDNCTSLVSLNFACLKGEISLASLERLVARSPNLKVLRLNRSVPHDTLQKILMRAPQLVDLGTGSFVLDFQSDTYKKLKSTFQKCNSIRSLSGFLEVAQWCLPVIYPICLNLTSLNLSYATGIRGLELIKLIQQCPKLQRLWV